MDELKTYIYDEISVGMEVSISKDITGDTIDQFCQISGDYHPFHTDNDFAKENSLNGIIAHGMLISSFASALVARYLPGRNMILLSQSFCYLKPVYPGSSIVINARVKRKIDSLRVIFVEVNALSESGVIHSSGEMKIKLLK